MVRGKENGSSLLVASSDRKKRQRTETEEVSSEHLKSERVSEQWHRLPRKVVESPSLKRLMNCLAMVLGKQVALLDQEDGRPEVSFNLSQSIIL